jgi:FkbM family methyltransferase
MKWREQSIKRIVSDLLRRIAEHYPFLALLLLSAVYPVPRLHVFAARAVGRFDVARRRVWRIPGGPLEGYKFTGLLPDEIAPILANRMEINCSRLLGSLSLEGAVAVDVGAGFGYYTILLSRLVGETGRVYSFEPDCGNFLRLSRNLSINMISNVTMAPICLWDSWAFKRWISVGERPWESRVVEAASPAEPDGKTIILAASLDEFGAETGIMSRVRFVKIDVEGAEARVLHGMTRILRQAKPAILCELHGAETAQDVFTFLSGIRYEWRMIEYAGEERQHIFAFSQDVADDRRVTLATLALSENARLHLTGES